MAPKVSKIEKADEEVPTHRHRNSTAATSPKSPLPPPRDLLLFLLKSSPEGRRQQEPHGPQNVSMPSVSVFTAIMSSYILVDKLAEDYVHQYHPKPEDGEPAWFDDYCGFKQGSFETGDGDEETVLEIPSLQQLPLMANIINPTWRLEAITNKGKDFPTRLPPALRSMAVQLKKHNESKKSSVVQTNI